VDESSRAAARGGRCWFVDPLDGTREFVKRNGEFCVMVGLAVDGRPVAGVLVAPAWQRRFVGVVGVGAYEILADGSRRELHAPVVHDPAQARLVHSRSNWSRTVDRAARQLGVRETRQCGSVGLKVALVATGEADLYLHAGHGPRLWDGCAPEAVALAAGADVTDAQGRALRYDVASLALDQGIVVAASPLSVVAARALAGA
jgi:3'(2'), 5'-bisphosphate nucleotidase